MNIPFFRKKDSQKYTGPSVNSSPSAILIQEGVSLGYYMQNMIAFDGEKTPLELGNPYDFIIDYYKMRQRAWEAFLTTDIIQNAIEKILLWSVGSGLKLQSEPIESIIGNNEYSQSIKSIEDQYRLFASMNYSSYNNNENLHSIASEAMKNAMLSGDCLIIARYDSDVNIQIVDGGYIYTPLDKIGEKNIINGVKVDSTGKHISYFVNTGYNKYTEVKAYNSIGQRVAWLMYGRKYKIDDVRGMSLLSAVLETAAKLDRYKEATVGSAEENAKIPYTIEHNQFSTGENPLVNQLAQSLGKGNGSAPETKDIDPNILATKIAQTTAKQTYNMPIGSTLKRHEAKVDIEFGDFFINNLDIIYATLGIPAEVALDKFEGSYSSSRAALKSWEYNLLVKRQKILTNQFYKPIYDFWLDLKIFTGEFNLNGYIKAFRKNNYNILGAYRNCRFIGAAVPHIDPLKEVNAARKKLGTEFDSVPLSSVEQVCEELNSGDFQQVIIKAKNEKSISSDFIGDSNNP